MALTDTLEGLPPWALYGGAAAVGGGGYLLYRRRKAASASGSAAPSTAAPAAVQSALDLGAQTQQSSIVPYYLTDQSASANGTGMGQRRPPRTIPSSIPSSTGVSSGSGAAQLPDIPPLLPPSSPGTPAPAPPPTTSPAPAPAQNNNLPPDLLQKIQANGEKIVDSIAAPGGGMWYLSDKGGVFAINAPFYGAAINQPYFGGGRKAMRLVSNGRGYTITDTAGENYSYA